LGSGREGPRVGEVGRLGEGGGERGYGEGGDAGGAGDTEGEEARRGRFLAVAELYVLARRGLLGLVRA